MATNKGANNEDMQAKDDPTDPEVAFTEEARRTAEMEGQDKRTARQKTLDDIYSRNIHEDEDPVTEGFTREEAADKEDEAEVDNTEEEEEQDQEEEVEETEEEEDDPDFWIDDDTGEVMTKVVVNGKEEIISAAKLKGSYQKDKASTERFQQAAKKEKEIEKRKSELEQMMERLQQPQQRRPSPQPQQQRTNMPTPEQFQAEMERLITEHQKALFDGEEEKGKALMKQILALQAQAVTYTAQSELHNWQRQKEAEEERKNQLLLRKAQAKFSEKFGWILKDPVAAGIADKFSMQLLNDEPELTFEQNLMKSGKLASQYLGKKVAATEINETDLEKRKERKKKTTLPRGRVSGARKSRAKSDEPQTPRNAVEEIAKARGQRYV